MRDMKPVYEAMTRKHHTDEGIIKKHEDMQEQFTQYERDLRNGRMSFREFELKRRAMLEEYAKLLDAANYSNENYDKYLREFWKSRHHFGPGEFRREYKIDSLNKVLTIYQNPSLTMQDYVQSDFTSSLTGYVLWGSGLTLAKYLEVSCASNSWIRGKKVLDLSSGTGYVGIVAACLGGDVTVTDLPQMIPFIQKNIDANSKELEGTGGKIRSQILRWGDREAVKALPKPDVILTSGVVYKEEAVEPLISTLSALSHKDTKLIMCNEDWRNHKMNSFVWNRFYSEASKHFKFSSISLKEVTPAPDTTGSFNGGDGVLLFQGRLR